MSKCAVIGGAGFIGSSLVTQLARQGHAVLSIDTKPATVTGATHLVCGMASAEAKDAMMDFHPDVVYFLAGPMQLRAGGTEQVMQAWLAEFTSMLDWVKTSGAFMVLVSSGGALYPDVASPAKETDAPAPVSLYGKANLLMEQAVQANGVPYTIIRFSNVYGPGQWASGLIPKVIATFASGSTAVAVDGDGKQTRDFLYIDDAVDALAVAGKQATGEVYHVGCGTDVGVLDLIGKIAKLMDIASWTTMLGISGPGAKRSVLDNQKFMQAFNWKPIVSLPEGLKKTKEAYGKTV